MTPAELVCELLYAGKTLAEVARLDDRQLCWVLARPRDPQGRLLRSGGLPPGVHVDADGMRVVVGEPVAFGTMFQQVKRFQGMTVEQAQQAWQQYRVENPRCGRGGDE